MSESGKQRWKCSWCGLAVEGQKPADPCPVCGAPADEFVESNEKVQEEIGETSLFYRPGGPLPGSDTEN